MTATDATARVLGKRVAATSPSAPSFEGVREVTAAVRAAGVPAKDLLRQATIPCRLVREAGSRRACLDCPRLVNYLPEPGRASVRIRCLWADDDPVLDLMTPARAWPKVSPATPIAAASALLASHERHHLLAVEAGLLAGIACACDLERAPDPGHPVARAMSRRVWILRADATLGDAAAIMQEQGIGCLPIVDREHIAGVITRGALAEAGFAG